MGIIRFPQDPPHPNPPEHLTGSAEQPYPYLPEAYRHLHIVGHLHENGRYLPVKVFVAPELVQAEQQYYWHKLGERCGTQKGFYRGLSVAAALTGAVVWAILVIAS